MIGQGDVLLFQTADGGNIIIKTNQDVTLTGGFETDFFLSLFGGNEQDNGSANNKDNWWANIMENDPAHQFRSRTQNILIGLPLVSGNLRKIEDAVRYDLNSYISNGAITELNVIISITGPRKVKIIINAFADGEKITQTFLANWQAMDNEFKEKTTKIEKDIAVHLEYQTLTNDIGEILTNTDGDELIGKVKRDG